MNWKNGHEPKKLSNSYFWLIEIIAIQLFHLKLQSQYLNEITSLDLRNLVQNLNFHSLDKQKTESFSTILCFVSIEWNLLSIQQMNLKRAYTKSQVKPRKIILKRIHPEKEKPQPIWVSLKVWGKLNLLLKMPSLILDFGCYTIKSNSNRLSWAVKIFEHRIRAEGALIWHHFTLSVYLW